MTEATLILIGRTDDGSAWIRHDIGDRSITRVESPSLRALTCNVFGDGVLRPLRITHREVCRPEEVAGPSGPVLLISRRIHGDWSIKVFADAADQVPEAGCVLTAGAVLDRLQAVFADPRMDEPRRASEIILVTDHHGAGPSGTVVRFPRAPL